MANLVELLILIIVVVVLFKINSKIKGRTDSKEYNYKYTDDEYFEKEVMRFENTIYAKDFNNKYVDLNRKGFETEGIYIFTNLSNNRKYVGQSIHLLSRVKGHLSGHGNPELHKDLKKGYEFKIQFIKLGNSEFNNLNALEKAYISKTNSYYGGYNKTRGNN